MPLLPNPWAGDKPQSIEQPGIVVNLRTFHNIHKRCHHGFTYPYELMEEKPDKIPFYEILGRGPPPSDVPGNPGDIYVDLSNPSKIMVYIRGSEQWLSWNTPPGLDGKSTPVYLAHHPLLEDRYLWRTLTTQGLSWVTEKTIKSVGILPQLTVDPSGQISDAYAKIIAGGEFCLRVGGRQTQLSSLPTAPSCTVSSLNPKKRKIDNSHSNINSPEKAVLSSSTAQIDMPNDTVDQDSGTQFIDGPFRVQSASLITMSAKATMLSEFLLEAEGAVALAEEREKEALIMLAKSRAMIERETNARIAAESRVAEIETKYRDPEKHQRGCQPEPDYERHRRVAYEYWILYEKEQKKRKEAEARVKAEESRRMLMEADVLVISESKKDLEKELQDAVATTSVLRKQMDDLKGMVKQLGLFLQ